MTNTELGWGYLLVGIHLEKLIFNESIYLYNNNFYIDVLCK